MSDGLKLQCIAIVTFSSIRYFGFPLLIFLFYESLFICVFVLECYRPMPKININ